MQTLLRPSRPTAPESPARRPSLMGVLAWSLALSFSPSLSQAQPETETDPQADAAVAPTPAPTEARLEALQSLASGQHPGVPLDSLLSVSLDDDSSMNERDRSARLERRRLLIASRQAERFGNKTPEEMALLRDQILALDLERKVLALPIEVRSRLVDQDAEGVAPAAADHAKPASSSGPGHSDTREPKGSAQNPVLAPTTAAPAADEDGSQSAEDAPSQRSTLEVLALVVGILLGTWLLVRLSTMALRWLGKRLVDRRVQLAQLEDFIRFGVGFVGVVAAFTVPMGLSREMLALVLCAIGLALAFAFRDFASSVFAGLLVVIERPFKIGDRIQVGELSGKVTEIGLASTRLLTPRSRVINVPNNLFLNKPIAMAQASSALTGLELDFYIDSNQDIGLAKRTLEEVIQTTRGADLPKPGVILVNQVLAGGAVAVRLRVKVFVAGSLAEHEIESELTERALDAFRTKSIRMPVEGRASAAEQN